jgi:hypothetical protein
VELRKLQIREEDFEIVDHGNANYTVQVSRSFQNPELAKSYIKLLVEDMNNKTDRLERRCNKCTLDLHWDKEAKIGRISQKTGTDTGFWVEDLSKKIHTPERCNEVISRVPGMKKVQEEFSDFEPLGNGIPGHD